MSESKILEFNLSDYYPETILLLDIKPFLFKGIAIKEKEFKAEIKGILNDTYSNKIVRIFCSEDVILPAWVKPYLVNQFSKYANFAFFTEDKNQFIESYFYKELANLDWSEYKNKRVLLRGCSDKEIPESAYQFAAYNLGKYVKKLSYGEICSQVPL